MKDQHRELLCYLRCDQTPHSGRMLFDHLKGVHDLLRDWGNDDVVCFAGLFHSIYGNSVFTHQSTNDRKLIAFHIGDHAELLVYYFNVKTRPLFEDVNVPALQDQLQEIEAANLFEQGSLGNALRKLRRENISNGAKMALQGVLG